MLNPMETNKLLTLEEIEELRIVNSLTDADARADLDSLMARLLTTARAYWELKEPSTLHSTSIQYIGQLRQWLNECRITDPSKMVDNKDIMEWLGIPVPEGYRTDKEVISEALGIKEAKPHAPTIKAIVEALEAGREFEVKPDGDDRIVFNSYEAIKSLEKHLE